MYHWNEETEERIVQAAQELFSLRPHRQVTLREVARKAGVTLSLIIYYFNSKKNLYRVAFEQAMDRHSEALQYLHDRLDRNRTISKTKAGEILKEMIGLAFDRMYRRTSKKNWHEKMVLYELINPSLDYEVLYEKYFKSHYRYLAKLIQCINRKIDDETAILIGITWVGQVFSFSLGPMMLAKDRTTFQYDDDEINTFKETVVANLLNIIERS